MSSSLYLYWSYTHRSIFFFSPRRLFWIWLFLFICLRAHKTLSISHDFQSVMFFKQKSACISTSLCCRPSGHFTALGFRIIASAHLILRLLSPALLPFSVLLLLCVSAIIRQSFTVIEDSLAICGIRILTFMLFFSFFFVAEGLEQRRYAIATRNIMASLLDH